MSVGMCECFIGCDGSPCAHQFVLWSENIADPVEFIPFTSKDERQRFARNALGTALPLKFINPFILLHELDSILWTFLVKIMTFQVR